MNKRIVIDEVRILKKIKLGVSDLNASRIGLGVMRMGTRSDLEAQQAVESAIGNGINFFESANLYGDGQSSSVFGRALKNANVARDSILIQSKGGIVRGHGFKRVDFFKSQFDPVSRRRTQQNWHGLLRRFCVAPAGCVSGT